jgi:REP element-mobilizing transposase RayT
MPRHPRLYVPGGFYHVTLRGNHRENIFSTAEDRRKLNAIVAEALAKYGARLHLFCWMTNHLHALLQIGEVKVGKVVQRIATRYSRYRHKQLRTSGHLFERRHDARLVDADSYFIALLRYIHLNPVEARMVVSPDDYEWSSHHAYAGNEVLPWLTVDFGLSVLSRTYGGARDAYFQLLHGKEGECEVDLTKLVSADDPRVIGTDRFVASLPPPRFKPKSGLTLEQLALDVCARYDVHLDDVRGANRRRQFTKARTLIARRAVEERIASINQVARFLNRSASALCQLLQRIRLD